MPYSAFTVASAQKRKFDKGAPTGSDETAVSEIVYSDIWTILGSQKIRKSPVSVENCCPYKRLPLFREYQVVPAFSLWADAIHKLTHEFTHTGRQPHTPSFASETS